MDFGLSNVPTMLATSTTGYLVEFAPIFLLIGGLVLAVGVITALISAFFVKKVDNENDVV